MCVDAIVKEKGFVVTLITVSVLLTIALLFGDAIGIRKTESNFAYEDLLFDTTYVHKLNIIMNDWENFLQTCENEQYADCSVIIDEMDQYDHVGIRAKGNTSLSNVRMMGSQRYSLKIEFDHYRTGLSYHGLDKLCLNNLIQDNTYLKDYLTYQLMNRFGAVSPLCSYVLVEANGEPWGLYLAIEGIEEGFLKRNFNGTGGILYKPDAMGLGGGPGNGRRFRMSEAERQFAGGNGMPPLPPNMDGNTGGMPPSPPNMDGDMSGMPPTPPGMDGNMGGMPPPPPDMDGNMGGMPPPPPGMDGNMGGMPPPPPDMGSPDVLLQYIGDSPSSYANIFANAKRSITRADAVRLIKSLKLLNEGKELERVLYIDDVIRYFVVHNYTVNGDSYTGNMIHNYYLYENEGRLSMIPWDYNLAFGSFQRSSATEAVNDSIFTPLSVTGDGSRPMADWMLETPYREKYLQSWKEFMEVANTATDEIINGAYSLIHQIVASEKDPTHFCSQEEFEEGVDVLREFCKLRNQSLNDQLQGREPSKDAASNLNLSAMGSMGGPGGPPSVFNTDNAAKGG